MPIDTRQSKRWKIAMLQMLDRNREHNLNVHFTNVTLVHETTHVNSILMIISQQGDPQLSPNLPQESGCDATRYPNQSR